MPPKARPAEELFWSKVVRSDGCWLWTAATDKDGYGKFQVTLSRESVSTGTKTPQRHLRAHHFAWEQSHDRVPLGMVLMHSCDVPSCVNPDHLSLGTPSLNYIDAETKGRIARDARNARWAATGEGSRKAKQMKLSL